MRLPVKPEALAERQEPDCNTPQCGQACINFYPSPNCSIEWGTIDQWGTTIIKDTAGLNTPFNLTPENNIQIMSLLYVSPDQLTNCPYMQFSFYDANNQSAGFTYITPGQTFTPCVQFGGAVVSYSGVTMLVDVPKQLLEWADTDGNVEEE